MNSAGTHVVNSVGVDVKQILTCFEMTFHYLVALWLCSILYLASGMGRRYLTFMGRNLEDGKNPMPVRIMNGAWYKYYEWCRCFSMVVVL